MATVHPRFWIAIHGGDRRELARDSATPAEVLYFIALDSESHEDAAQAALKNRNMPPHAFAALLNLSIGDGTAIRYPRRFTALALAPVTVWRKHVNSLRRDIFGNAAAQAVVEATQQDILRHADVLIQGIADEDGAARYSDPEYTGDRYDPEIDTGVAVAGKWATAVDGVLVRQSDGSWVGDPHKADPSTSHVLIEHIFVVGTDISDVAVHINTTVERLSPLVLPLIQQATKASVLPHRATRAIPAWLDALLVDRYASRLGWVYDRILIRPNDIELRLYAPAIRVYRVLKRKGIRGWEVVFDLVSHTDQKTSIGERQHVGHYPTFSEAYTAAEAAAKESGGQLAEEAMEERR